MFRNRQYGRGFHRAGNRPSNARSRRQASRSEVAEPIVSELEASREIRYDLLFGPRGDATKLVAKPAEADKPRKPESSEGDVWVGAVILLAAVALIYLHFFFGDQIRIFEGERLKYGVFAVLLISSVIRALKR